MRIVSPAVPASFLRRPMGLPLQPAPVKFGETTYTDLLTRKPVVTLTPAQQTTLHGFEEMAQTHDLRHVRAYLKLLDQPEYTHLLHVQHRNPDDPNWKTAFTSRKRYHTPFSDLYLKLSPAARRKLVDHLAERVKRPTNENTRTNAIGALVDIYCYALRPGGKAFQGDSPANTPKRLMNQQQHLLGVFNALLSNENVPILSRRLLRNELIFGQCDIIRKDWPVVKPAETDPVKVQLMAQITPLIQKPQPTYPIMVTVPIPVANALKTAIRNGDTEGILRVMQHDSLQKLVPDWKRAFGPDNYQHSAQDYSLGDHLRNAYETTRASQYFQRLTAEEQFRVSTAAIFHDIAKRTGPKNFRDTDRITPDLHHPWRSAEVMLQALPALHYTPEEIADIYTLVQRHQNLGGLAKPDDKPPTPERVVEVAQHLQRPAMVTMLAALTEGDVRSVKRFNPDAPHKYWFNPAMEASLARYTAIVTDHLPKS